MTDLTHRTLGDSIRLHGLPDGVEPASVEDWVARHMSPDPTEQEVAGVERLQIEYDQTYDELIELLHHGAPADHTVYLRAELARLRRQIYRTQTGQSLNEK